MRIILDIADDMFIKNCKAVEMSILDDKERKILHEKVSLEYFPIEAIKNELATRLKQLASQEIENYVNSKFP